MTTEVNVAAEYEVERRQTGAIELAELCARVSRLGKDAVRLSVAGVFGWIGAMKFNAYEAGAVEGLVTSSHLTSSLYDVFSLQGAASGDRAQV